MRTVFMIGLLCFIGIFALPLLAACTGATIG